MVCYAFVCLPVGLVQHGNQVFLTTLDLLDATLGSIGRCNDARHNHVVAALEPTTVTLLHKLGDGQARLRDAAMNGVMAVARCRTAGAVFVRYSLSSCSSRRTYSGQACALLWMWFQNSTSLPAWGGLGYRIHVHLQLQMMHKPGNGSSR